MNCLHMLFTRPKDEYKYPIDIAKTMKVDVI